MKIYVIYKRFYADYESCEDGEVFMHGAYKNKRKATKKGIALANYEKRYHCIDKNIKNKRNPFKNNKRVEFYKDEEQEEKVMSIVIEEMKLVA